MLVFLLQNFLRAERECWTNLLTPVCVFVLSHVQLFSTSWTVAHQAPLSMKFSRQKYRLGLPFSTPGDLCDPGIEPVSLASPVFAGGFFTTSTTWEVQA